ncbi:hypothetical protein [Woeseia oceani]|uniref:Uncharacterized protein n=1 Tax=Woeseia oceani TaxID=1548547 RepID=A0A193LCH2_9GAMM|nr:hypothetical protein [Woeseia oceani]ANO50207.1 hypothetical protein BA177_02315 [Woeseia oceani]
MNTEDHNDAEQRLRETYHSSQDVRAPDKLNRAVLESAAAAATAKPGIGQILSAWGRPLAFAATLVLGIALVYDMQNLAPLPADEASSESAPSLSTGSGVANDDDTPANRAIRQMREEKLSTSEPRQAAPSPEQRSDLTNRQLPQLNKFGNSRRATRPSNEKAGQALNEATQVPAESRTTPDSTAAAVAAAQADMTYNDSRDNWRQCQEAEANGADEWWQCIVDLQESGADEVADKERLLLNRRHPDFNAPE